MLPDEDIVPVHINSHAPSEAEAAQGSRYEGDFCYDWFPHSPDGTPKWQTWAQHISWPPSHWVYLRL